MTPTQLHSEILQNIFDCMWGEAETYNHYCLPYALIGMVGKQFYILDNENNCYDKLSKIVAIATLNKLEKTFNA